MLGNTEINCVRDLNVVPAKLQKRFCHSLKETLREYFIKYWENQVQQGGDTGKLRLYRKLKTNLGLSAHKLPVETGGYHNVQYSNRICEHCDENQIGDEQHALFNVVQKCNVH